MKMQKRIKKTLTYLLSELFQINCFNLPETFKLCDNIRVIREFGRV